jgi:protein SCO1/2
VIRPGRAWFVAALVGIAALAPTSAANAQFMTGKRVDRARATAEAAATSRELVERVGFDQHLGADLPLDLPLRDERGRDVRLGDYFGERPVVLGLVYYRCPVLCTLIERGLASGLKPLELEPGADFEVVFVSIDPTDGPETASERKQATLASYGRPETADGWHFLSGDEGAIAQLAETVGFRYALDPATGQYAHAAGLTVATPDGRLSRYLFGVDYAPRDLQLSLVESSNGAIGGPVDKLLLICFRYDATLGKYTAATFLALRIGATLTLGALGAFLFFALRRDRRQRRLAAGGPA